MVESLILKNRAFACTWNFVNVLGECMASDFGDIKAPSALPMMIKSDTSVIEVIFSPKFCDSITSKSLLALSIAKPKPVAKYTLLSLKLI